MKKHLSLLRIRLHQIHNLRPKTRCVTKFLENKIGEHEPLRRHLPSHLLQMTRVRVIQSWTRWKRGRLTCPVRTYVRDGVAWDQLRELQNADCHILSRLQYNQPRIKIRKDFPFLFPYPQTYNTQIYIYSLTIILCTLSMDFLEKKHRVPEVVLESLSPTSQAAISRLQDHLPEPFDLSVVIKYTSV